MKKRRFSEVAGIFSKAKVPAIIAHPDNKKRRVVRANMFSCEATGLHVMLNAADNPFSPITGKNVRRIDVANEQSEIELTTSDLEDLVVIARDADLEMVFRADLELATLLNGKKIFNPLSGAEMTVAAELDEEVDLELAADGDEDEDADEETDEDEEVTEASDDDATELDADDEDDSDDEENIEESEDADDIDLDADDDSEFDVDDEDTVEAEDEDESDDEDSDEDSDDDSEDEDEVVEDDDSEDEDSDDSEDDTENMGDTDGDADDLDGADDGDGDDDSVMDDSDDEADEDEEDDDADDDADDDSDEDSEDDESDDSDDSDDDEVEALFRDLSNAADMTDIFTEVAAHHADLSSIELVAAGDKYWVIAGATPIAYAQKAACVPTVAKVFDKQPVFASALTAALKESDNVINTEIANSFGLTLLETEVRVSDSVTNEVKRRVGVETAKLATERKDLEKKIHQAVAVAAAGINKGQFGRNPLRDALLTELSSLGVPDAENIVMNAFRKGGEAHLKAILGKAKELANASDDKLNAYAEMARDANYSVEAASGSSEFSSSLHRIGVLSNREDGEKETAAATAFPAFAARLNRYKTKQQ